MNFKCLSLIVIFCFHFLLTPLHAASKIGVIAALQGNVSIQSDITKDKKTPGKVGDPINENQMVITEDNSKAQILLKDQTTLSIGPNSEVVIDQFVLGAGSDKGTLSASFKKGLFKYTSGKIATDRGNVKINVPNTVITVRGTEFLGNIKTDKTSVVLLSGAISLTSLNRVQEVVRSGFGVTIGGPGSISAPVAIPPSELKQLIEVTKVSFIKPSTLAPQAQVDPKTNAPIPATAQTVGEKPAATLDNTLGADGKPKPKFDNVVVQSIVKEESKSNAVTPKIDSSQDTKILENKSTDDVKGTLATEFKAENNIPNTSSGGVSGGQVTANFYGATLAPIFTDNPSSNQYSSIYWNAVAGVSSPSATTFNAGQIVGKLELYINSAATGLAEKFDVSVTGGGASYFYVEDGFIKTRVASSAFFASGGWIGKDAGRVNLELRDAAGNLITTINGLDFVNH